MQGEGDGDGKEFEMMTEKAKKGGEGRSVGEGKTSTPSRTYLHSNLRELLNDILLPLQIPEFFVQLNQDQQ